MRDDSGRGGDPATRRTFLCGLVALPFVLSACTGDDQGSTDGADVFPVDVTHRFGTTTVRERPVRIATFGFAAADVCLSLGTAPLGMPGSNATPWYNLERIAKESMMPVLYPGDLDLALPQIEALEPDLIFTVGADITRAQYEQLSRIAPVVHGMAEGKPSWRDVVDVVASALGRTSEGTTLVGDTEQHIRESVDDYPDLAGTTFLAVEAFPAVGADLAVYGPSSEPANVLVEFGLSPASPPPGLEEAVEVEDEVFGAVGQNGWPRARAVDLRPDVLIVVAERRRVQEITDELAGDLPSAVQMVPAAKDEMGAALIMASPISIAWLARNFLPVVAEAAFNARQ